MRILKYSALILFSVLVSCSKTVDNTGTCHDGIKNQGEQDVDCGGPCPNHCQSCADGIQNEGEEAVDCGGPCDVCYPLVSAKLDGVTWLSTSRNAFLFGPGILRIYGTNQVKNITLNYSGPFQTGTVASGAQFTGELRDENGNLYSSGTAGSITFTTFDVNARKVSGIYRFTAIDTLSGTSIEVANGVFNVLNY